tara:strand:+ start:769 stop:2010 length:1242 start_codon:yes stop_codon:yes gene_type:complete
MRTELPTLYKKDTSNKIRQWSIITEGNKFWTEQGILDGKIVVNKPTVAYPKNIGKSNETSDEEQALVEAKAKWEIKKSGEYFESIDAAQNEKKFFKPMLADKFDDRQKDLKYPVITQPKLDGIRCIIQKTNDEIQAHTRNGKKIDAIPHILNSLKEFFKKNPYAILDGELYNHDLRNNFNKITSLVRKQKPIRTKNDTDNSFEKKEKEFTERCEEAKSIIQYWIYDAPIIASISGTTELVKDMVSVDDNVIFYQSDPFIERFNEIIMWFYDKYDCINVVPTFESEDQEHLDDYYGKYLDEGFEGQMVRAIESTYENKRSKNLLKRKEFIDEEFEVINIEEGAGNRTGTAKHLVCKNKDGKTFNSNIKGTFEYLEEILKNKKDYIGKLATIKFFQYTPDRVPRFPYAIGFRDYE